MTEVIPKIKLGIRFFGPPCMSMLLSEWDSTTNHLIVEQKIGLQVLTVRVVLE